MLFYGVTIQMKTPWQTFKWYYLFLMEPFVKKKIGNYLGEDLLN